MIRFDFVEFVERLEFLETVAVFVEHLLNELGGTQCDELSRHDRWRVVIKWLVVFVTFGLDARQARDEHDGVQRDILDDRVLVGSIQRIEKFASGRPLVANVILDARDVDPHRLDRHVLDLAVVVVVLVRIDDLDVEHGGQHANQCIDELRLLRHEQ